MAIHLLAQFQVIVNGVVIPQDAWKRRKARAIVKLLALAPSHALHREEIIDQLWPDLDPVTAGNSLRVALHLARGALRSANSAGHSPSLLVLHGDQLHLSGDGSQQLWIDAEQFTIAAREARAGADVDRYHQAIARYTGDLLPEDRYEDWTTAPREALRESYLGLLLSLANLHESRDQHPDAIAVLERAVALEPTLEDAHAAMMRLYAITGRHGLALRQYARLREVLARELDVHPSTATQRLHADIASGTLSAPDARTVPSHTDGSLPRHNLPLSVSRFIGRSDAITELRLRLTTTRLLTLTGAGGSGKTRLAIELARASIDTYIDGAWLVELAPLRDPSLLPRTVASALDVVEQPGRAATDLLREALRSKSLLLILDNCEHVVDACAEFAESLLHTCPDLRIVATSREALRVPGEVAWRVPLLSLPESSTSATRRSSPDLRALGEIESVTLLIDRLRWVRPDFTLTEDNADAVVAICRRLEGLPLALELAAARASVLSPQQIADRLENTIGLLSAGNRTVATRQRTMEATLDWSYALLDRREQTLLQRLSIFAGSWTLDAAEQVCSDANTIVREDILNVLAELVAKSLVQIEDQLIGHSGTTEVRYRLLETVRQYAAGRLIESGDATRIGDRHAAYFLSLAIDADPAFRSSNPGGWTDRLEREHDNLRAVLHWAIDRGDLELEARLCSILWRFWYLQGHFVEWDRWLQGVVTRMDEHHTVVPPLLRAKVLQGAAALAWNQGDPIRSEMLSLQALPLFKESDDAFSLSVTLHALGIVAELRGDYDQARDRYLVALRLREELGDRAGTAVSLHSLANIDREQGNLAQAADLYERSVALQQQIGNIRGVALALSGLAVVALDQGDYVLSAAVSSQAIELWNEIGARARAINVVNNLGYAVMYQGDTARAIAVQAECLRIAVDVGDQRGIAYGLEGMASAIALHDLTVMGAEQAARMFGAAEALREVLQVPLPPADAALNARSVTTARSRLGEQAFAQAWKTGRSTPIDDAVTEAFALSVMAPETQQVGRSTPDLPLQALTPREREVVTLVSQGLSNREIATALGMANRTVDTHVSNILRKLGLASRTDVRG